MHEVLTYSDEDELINTPGTAGGPGVRDRTLAAKSKKKSSKSVFFGKNIKIT